MLSICARRKEELEKVAQEAKENGADDVLVLAKDLYNVEAAKSIVVETVEHFGSKPVTFRKTMWCQLLQAT